MQSVAGLGTTGQVLTSNGAAALPTFQNVTSSGTVDTGVLNHLTWYPASTAEVASSSFLINNSTGALVIPGVLTTGGQISMENGSVSAPGLSFTSELTTGLYLVSSQHLAVTLGGVQAADFIGSNYLLMSLPINMNTTNKIIGLANGTASTDAAAFGQIYTGFQALVQGTSTSSANTTNTTFTATNLSASITPTSSAHRIKITVSGTLEQTTNAKIGYATLTRAGSNILGANGFAALDSTLAGDTFAPAATSYIDSPASTSSLTYSVQIRTTSGGQVFWGDAGETQIMILEEIV